VREFILTSAKVEAVLAVGKRVEAAADAGVRGNARVLERGRKGLHDAQEGGAALAFLKR
jgi:hypothetical protein